MKAWIKSFVFGLMVVCVGIGISIVSGDSFDINFSTFLLTVISVLFFTFISHILFKNLEKKQNQLKKQIDGKIKIAISKGNYLFRYFIPIALVYVICSIIWPLTVFLVVLTIVLMLKVSIMKKKMIPLKRSKISTIVFFILTIIFICLLCSTFQEFSDSNKTFFEIIIPEDDLPIGMYLAFILNVWFIKILNSCIGLSLVRKEIKKNKSINLSEEYDLKGNEVNKFLVSHTKDMNVIQNEIKTLTPNKDQLHQRLVLSVIYPHINNYDAIVIRKFNTLYYINTSKMLENLKLSEEEKELIVKRLNNDYASLPLDDIEILISSVSGVLCGLIDSLFVGKPGESKLEKFTTDKTDKLVMKIAKLFGWNPKEKNKENISSAIGFLERKFSIPYDARYDSDLGIDSAYGDKVGMTASNHHLLSLAHSPDIIGLIFSLLDQFISSEEEKKHTTIVSNGKIKMFLHGDTEFKLKGDDIISKLFCGFVNWIGHIMSDVAGSSGGRGKNNASSGEGVSAPFFELLQFANFGSLGNDKRTVAELSIKLFEKGYDARFMAAASIPVILNEYIIRISYIIKQHYCEKIAWEEIEKSILLPTNKIFFAVDEDQKLNKMLLIGYGIFCATDLTDAIIRGKGFTFDALLHINLVGWKQLAMEGFRSCLSVFRKLSSSPEKIEQELLEEAEKFQEMN